jgi:hypothetical protein
MVRVFAILIDWYNSMHFRTCIFSLYFLISSFIPVQGALALCPQEYHSLQYDLVNYAATLNSKELLDFLCRKGMHRHTH